MKTSQLFLRTSLIIFIGAMMFSVLGMAQAQPPSLNGKFQKKYTNKSVKAGYTFQGTLVLWPTSKRPKTFYQLEEMELGQALYVSKVFSSQVSKNNADAVKVEALFTVLDGFNIQETVTFEIDDQRVALKLPSIRVEKLDKAQMKGKKLSYIDQSVNVARTYLPWALLALVVIFALQFLIRRQIAKKQEEKRLRQLKSKWEKKFKEAESREQYEEIYQHKEEWLELVDIKSPPLLYFFDTIYHLQFKKNWGDEDLHRIKENFDQIRYMFSDGNT